MAADGSLGSAISDHGAVEVECISIDELLSDPTPTLLKMDIEGAEPDAIARASRVLRSDALVLAVCLYHRQEDLWQISLQIRAANPGYRLFLRQHTDDCWEEVVYAIPAHRLRPGTTVG